MSETAVPSAPRIQVSFYAGGDHFVLRADSGEELDQVASDMNEYFESALKKINDVKQAQVALGVFSGDSQREQTKKSERKPDLPPPSDSNGRVYLDVPFSEKDAAKALGARFDGNAKKWYVEEATPEVERWIK